MSSPPKSGAKKTRAKHACRECNSRRVRCDVMEVQPCSNCALSGGQCEVVPSRRGRYPRRSRRHQQSSVDETTASLSPHLAAATQAQSSPLLVLPRQSSRNSTRASQQHVSQDPIPAHHHIATPAPTATAGTLFFGESNFLTLVPGDELQATEANSTGSQKPRLTFPIPDTPDSSSCIEGKGISAATMRYLRDEGALTVPDINTCLPALQAYFTWFHPCFPVLDRTEITRRLAAMDISRLLLQAMLFIGATYCDEPTITAMGFQDRSEAKSVFYTRARLLFHADWEKDKVPLIQSLFLMSFWRGGPSDVRDVRYWLGVVITLAESYGLHRSPKSTQKNTDVMKMRRRIWWSIYVRERQAAASLGLPSRIRDEDCDLEALSPSDLESDATSENTSLFGSCQNEHITYAIKMVELSRLLGKVIDLHFVPGQRASTEEDIQDLDTSLEAWKQSLPDYMKCTSDEESYSVWAGLLHFAYNHLRILIHRDSFLRHGEGNKSEHIVTSAACRISRIAEDMSTQGILRYGQMHLITSLFAALFIHVIGIRRSNGVSRRIAEHRAQMCLLCLKEVQKYWRINNNVLDLFLQYLDRSIAERLHGTQSFGTGRGLTGGITTGADIVNEVADRPFLSSQRDVDMDGSMAALEKTQPQDDLFEDQYFSLMNGRWEGDNVLEDLELFLQADDFSQAKGLDFLGRAL